jgi:hypothetical protein
MRKVSFVTVLLVMAGVSAARAQEPVRAPELTVEQRWALAAANLNAFMVAFLEVGREHGQSPEEVGMRLGEFFGPAWGGRSGTGDPARLARGMATNLLVWPGAEVSLTEADDGAYVLRHNRPWTGWFAQRGPQAPFSVDDFEAMFNAAMASLGDYLGLEVESRREEGDWVQVIRAGS